MENGKEKEPRFNQEQYEMLLRCSQKRDMTEWNEWRKAHPNEDIVLEGARLEGAWLVKADLQGAWLLGAHLQRACLLKADVRGADFSRAELEGADFSRVIVDGTTLVWECEIDRNTKFEGVVLGTIRVYPATRQLLEYNIRRMNWEDWYKGHPVLKWLVRWFWAFSDYGRSTGWVLAWFLIFAAVFAGIYWVWGLAEPPGIVSNLFELEGTTEGVYTYQLIDMTRIERQPGEPIKVSRGTAFVRALYFSVVTMTTLGFGDLYANPVRIPGHILLAIQVILGYVLLGALVTRFAVLFTAGGPAGRFLKRRIANSEQGMSE